MRGPWGIKRIGSRSAPFFVLHQRDPLSASGGVAGQRLDRDVHPTTLKAGNERLCRIHALCQLLLRQVGVFAGVVQGDNQIHLRLLFRDLLRVGRIVEVGVPLDFGGVRPGKVRLRSEIRRKLSMGTAGN